MVKKMCTYGKVGQATIVFGATWAYAMYLARSIGDTANAPLAVNGSTYTVTCTVDTTDVFGYRMVKLSLQNQNISESSYARSIVGLGSYTPETLTISDVLIASAAAANWQLLMQYEGLDRLFDGISQVALIPSGGIQREPPWAFNNPANGLEDVLGLVATIVSSRINSTMTTINATSLVTVTRIGSGNTLALAYTIPPAVAAVVLV